MRDSTGAGGAAPGSRAERGDRGPRPRRGDLDGQGAAVLVQRGSWTRPPSGSTSAPCRWTAAPSSWPAASPAACRCWRAVALAEARRHRRTRQPHGPHRVLDARGEAAAGRQSRLAAAVSAPASATAGARGPCLRNVVVCAVQRRGWREMGSGLRTNAPDIEVQGDTVQGSQSASPSPSSDRAAAAWNSGRGDRESAPSPSPTPSPRWWVEWSRRNPVRSDSWIMLPARQQANYKKRGWLALMLILAGLLVVLLIGSVLWFFLYGLAVLIVSAIMVGQEPAAIAKSKAITLQPVFEKQVRDWEVIIKEVKGLRRWLPRHGKDELLGECDRLLKDAKRELRDSRRRLKEHREAFNTAYWVYQHVDQRGRPRYKYVIHRGLCDSCNNGQRKPSMWVGLDGDGRRWHGPYDELIYAQASGVGNCRFCWRCCPDLPSPS